MADLICSTYITLDGVIEHPEHWPDMGGFGPAGNKIQTDLVLSASAILMGRRTYEQFAPVWPTMTGNPLGDAMNSLPKYVASTTLTTPDWNNTRVIQGNLVDVVKELKEQADGPVVQFGFGETTRTLIKAALLDRLRLWVHPLMGLGGPGDTIHGSLAATTFTLDDATTLPSGIVVLDYRVSHK